jgi:hypothetical protein
MMLGFDRFRLCPLEVSDLVLAAKQEQSVAGSHALWLG